MKSLISLKGSVGRRRHTSDILPVNEGHFHRVHRVTLAGLIDTNHSDCKQAGVAQVKRNVSADAYRVRRDTSRWERRVDRLRVVDCISAIDRQFRCPSNLLETRKLRGESQDRSLTSWKKQDHAFPMVDGRQRNKPTEMQHCSKILSIAVEKRPRDRRLIMDELHVFPSLSQADSCSLRRRWLVVAHPDRL